MPKKNSNPNTFEDKLARLEQIVGLLENGSVTLEESMALFREGTALAGDCSKRLDEAEQEIVLLTKGPDGSVEEEPFAHEDLT